MSELETDLPFAIVPMWVATLPISDRAVRLYSLLAGMRDYASGRASFGRKFLAEKLHCSNDSLDRAKAELEEHGAISIERGEANGGAIPRNVYMVHRIPPDSRKGADTSSGTGAAMYQKKRTRSSTTTGAQLKTVGGSKVTDPEISLASSILSTYNEIFEAKRGFSGREWLKDIIGRIREHPELTLEDHRAVMEKMKANPWWKGDPSPSVIYGNGRIFDRSLNAQGEKSKDGNVEELAAYDRSRFRKGA